MPSPVFNVYVPLLPPEGTEAIDYCYMAISALKKRSSWNQVSSFGHRLWLLNRTYIDLQALAIRRQTRKGEAQRKLDIEQTKTVRPTTKQPGGGEHPD